MTLDLFSLVKQAFLIPENFASKSGPARQSIRLDTEAYAVTHRAYVNMSKTKFAMSGIRGMCIRVNISTGAQKGSEAQKSKIKRSRTTEVYQRGIDRDRDRGKDMKKE